MANSFTPAVDSEGLAVLIKELRKRVEYFGEEVSPREGCETVRIDDKTHYFRFVYEPTWNAKELEAGRRYLFLATALWGMAVDARRLLREGDPVTAIERMAGLVCGIFELAEVERPLIKHVNKIRRATKAREGRTTKREQLRDERREREASLYSVGRATSVEDAAKIIAIEESEQLQDGKERRIKTVLQDLIGPADGMPKPR